jgi:hypothetical protein
VPVPHELSGLSPVHSEPHSEYHVVEASFEHFEQILTGNALLAISLDEVTPELPFEQSVNSLDFLFFTQLQRVIALVAFELDFSGMLTRRKAASLESAFWRHTAVALEI